MFGGRELTVTPQLRPCPGQIIRPGGAGPASGSTTGSGVVPPWGVSTGDKSLQSRIAGRGPQQPEHSPAARTRRLGVPGDVLQSRPIMASCSRLGIPPALVLAAFASPSIVPIMRSNGDPAATARAAGRLSSSPGTSQAVPRARHGYRLHAIGKRPLDPVHTRVPSRPETTRTASRTRGRMCSRRLRRAAGRPDGRRPRCHRTRSGGPAASFRSSGSRGRSPVEARPARRQHPRTRVSNQA